MIEKTNKKKQIILSILVIALVLIITGVTYAVFSYSNSNARNNTINSGQVSMTYIEQSNSYVLENALPKFDSLGMNDTNYFEFTISSSAKTNANDTVGIQIPYEINISSKAIDEGKQQLPEENIKVYLTKVENGKEVGVISPTKISDLGSSIYRENATKVAYKLNSHKNGNETISTTYRLRAWIDIMTDASNWTEDNKYQYKFTVNVNSDTKYVGYTTDPSCFTFEDDGNNGKKITAFSSTCSAKNIIVPSTYTEKTSGLVLKSYTANEDAWIELLKTTEVEEGQTYEEYLAANNKTDEEFVAEAKASLKEMTSTFDSYIGKDINEPDEYDSTTVLDIYNLLQDPTNEEYEMYSKVFTMKAAEQTIFNNYKVTEISTTDFKNKGIQSIILPENIKLTNDDTFVGNSIDLLIDTNGHLPDSCLNMTGTVLTSFRCRGIKNLDLSDKNITEIEQGDKYYPRDYPTFYGLETAVLPSTLETIGIAAFERNKLITLDLSNTKITELKKHVFDTNKITNLKLPSNIEVIGDYAFRGNQISNIEFPSTLKSIGDEAFANDDVDNFLFAPALPIETIDLSNTQLTTIGSEAFDGHNITTIKLPATVTLIGKRAFSKGEYNNPNLKSIIYPGTTAFDWDNILSLYDIYGTTKHLPPYTTNGVSITAS